MVIIMKYEERIKKQIKKYEYEKTIITMAHDSSNERHGSK